MSSNYTVYAEDIVILYAVAQKKKSNQQLWKMVNKILEKVTKLRKIVVYIQYIFVVTFSAELDVTTLLKLVHTNSLTSFDARYRNLHVKDALSRKLIHQ